MSDEVFDELADNPTKRVPVCLCLDTSSSMDGDPISELNDGVRAFYDAINDDDVAKSAADVCIVTFGYNGVVENQGFQSIDGEIAPSFYAGGNTPMGAAVEKALDLLESRKSEYRNSGVDYFQPWLVIITDGAPTDNIDRAASRSSDMANNGKLTIFPIGVGGANMDTLRRFSPKRNPMKLKGLHFKEFFEWLSKSISITSRSRAGDSVNLPDTSGWGTL